MKITKKSSCLDHKTLSDTKQQSFAESYCFIHCKVSKLKPNFLAMGTKLHFFFFFFFLFSLPVLTSAHNRFLNL
uniref:Uncharacterized protein n=1 Tax=Saimiri boliviensis boliviensis TaxID=39432 RepID=A0A2K6URC2_SAIBB